MVVDTIGDSGDMLIDISHESLIRHWKALNIWVDEESEAAIQYTRLCEAYIAHTENRKDLLSGREYEISQEWLEKFKPTKTWSTRYNNYFNESTKYLAASGKVYNKEMRNKRRLKRVKKTVLYSFLVLACMGAFYYLTRPITDEKAWEVAITTNTIDGYETYLDSYGKGTHAPIAQDSISSLTYKGDLKAAWLEANALNAVKGYENYLNLAAATRNPDGKILTYSTQARFVETAKKRIDSLKNTVSTTVLDEAEWQKAERKNTVSSYLNYIRNEKVIGEYDMLAAVKIQEIGKTGYLYCGKLEGNQIYDPVFDLIYRSGTEYKEDDMLRTNDIVRALQNRRIYSNPSVTQVSGSLVEQDSIYFVKSINLQANAVFVEIVY